MREKQFSVIKDELIKDADTICEFLGDFKTGPRGIFLMNRTKDGGGSTEEKRLVRFDLYTEEETFRRLLLQYLVLKEVLHPLARIYISVNRRDINRSVRTLEGQLLEAHYSPEDQRQHVYYKLMKSMRTALMQPTNKSGSMFLLDIDNQFDEHGKKIDVEGAALCHLYELGVQVIHKQSTKNGWHLVTEPFNPALWDNSLGELKKDALLCIAF